MSNLGDFNPYKYAEELVAVYPTITEIWLYGSRANSPARENSDWDILVLADERVFQALRNNDQLNRPNIDLVVAPSFVGNYQKPWGKQNTSKSFESLNLKYKSETEACYQIAKWIPDPCDPRKRETRCQSGDWEEVTLRAFRLWPRQ